MQKDFKHKLLGCLQIRKWRTTFLNENGLNMNIRGSLQKTVMVWDTK